MQKTKRAVRNVYLGSADRALLDEFREICRARTLHAPAVVANMVRKFIDGIKKGETK